MSAVSIDVWSLFIALLVTALLQEFTIRPSVDLIKKYYHKSRKHVEERLFGNGNNASVKPFFDSVVKEKKGPVSVYSKCELIDVSWEKMRCALK